MRALRSHSLLRTWLLILTLFFGQAAMLAHGAEHFDGGEPPHACRFCLAGQSVDGPVPPASLPVFELTPLLFILPSASFAEGESAVVTPHLARGPPAA